MKAKKGSMTTHFEPTAETKNKHRNSNKVTGSRREREPEVGPDSYASRAEELTEQEKQEEISKAERLYDLQKPVFDKLFRYSPEVAEVKAAQLWGQVVHWMNKNPQLIEKRTTQDAIDSIVEAATDFDFLKRQHIVVNQEFAKNLLQENASAWLEALGIIGENREQLLALRNLRHCCFPSQECLDKGESFSFDFETAKRNTIKINIFFQAPGAGLQLWTNVKLVPDGMSSRDVASIDFTRLLYSIKVGELVKRIRSPTAFDLSFLCANHQSGCMNVDHSTFETHRLNCTRFDCGRKCVHRAPCIGTGSRYNKTRNGCGAHLPVLFSLIDELSTAATNSASDYIKNNPNDQQFISRFAENNLSNDDFSSLFSRDSKFAHAVSKFQDFADTLYRRPNYRNTKKRNNNNVFNLPDDYAVLEYFGDYTACAKKKIRSAEDEKYLLKKDFIERSWMWNLLRGQSAFFGAKHAANITPIPWHARKRMIENMKKVAPVLMYTQNHGELSAHNAIRFLLLQNFTPEEQEHYFPIIDKKFAGRASVSVEKIFFMALTDTWFETQFWELRSNQGHFEVSHLLHNRYYSTFESLCLEAPYLNSGRVACHPDSCEHNPKCMAPGLSWFVSKFSPSFTLFSRSKENNFQRWERYKQQLSEVDTLLEFVEQHRTKNYPGIPKMTDDCRREIETPTEETNKQRKARRNNEASTDDLIVYSLTPIERMFASLKKQHTDFSQFFSELELLLFSDENLFKIHKFINAARAPYSNNLAGRWGYVIAKVYFDILCDGTRYPEDPSSVPSPPNEISRKFLIFFHPERPDSCKAFGFMFSSLEVMDRKLSNMKPDLANFQDLKVRYPRYGNEIVEKFKRNSASAEAAKIFIELFVLVDITVGKMRQNYLLDNEAEDSGDESTCSSGNDDTRRAAKDHSNNRSKEIDDDWGLPCLARAFTQRRPDDLPVYYTGPNKRGLNSKAKSQSHLFSILDYLVLYHVNVTIDKDTDARMLVEDMSNIYSIWGVAKREIQRLPKADWFHLRKNGNIKQKLDDVEINAESIRRSRIPEELRTYPGEKYSSHPLVQTALQTFTPTKIKESIEKGKRDNFDIGKLKAAKLKNKERIVEMPFLGGSVKDCIIVRDQKYLDDNKKFVQSIGGTEDGFIGRAIYCKAKRNAGLSAREKHSQLLSGRKVAEKPSKKAKQEPKKGRCRRDPRNLATATKKKPLETTKKKSQVKSKKTGNKGTKKR